MSEELKPGYYWAFVSYPFDNKWKLEIVEWYWSNEIDFQDEDEEYNATLTKEYEWMLCGSEVPVWPHDRIKLIPHNGPLQPPTDAINFFPVRELDPHPAAVKMVDDIQPVRDNGNDG